MSYPRYSIRDVLWLTVLVAVAVGWWIDRRHWAVRCSALEQSNKALDDRYRQAVVGFEDAVRTVREGHH
jgi:hypothetical protein